MPYVDETKTIELKAVTITKAANGWHVAPSYKGRYDGDESAKIAYSPECAIAHARDFMETPRVEVERVWKDSDES